MAGLGHPGQVGEAGMSAGKPDSSRREVLGLLTAVVAAAAERTARAGQGASAPPPATGSLQWALAIDLGRCTRCEACVVACAAENNVAPLGGRASGSARPIHWMDMLEPDPRRAPWELGPWPVPVPCMHCENAPCVQACPVGASYHSDDGIVIQVWERCIGCRACMLACPYSRRYYNWVAPNWSSATGPGTNPDVAIRPAGVVEKCSLCHHRIRTAVERARLDEEMLDDAKLQQLPACAAACPARAITFGNLSDPRSAVSTAARSARAIALLAHLGTRPRVFYLRGNP